MMPAFLVTWLLRGLPYILALAVIVGALFAAEHYGYRSGAASVQLGWNADKAVRAEVDAKAIADAAATSNANTQAAVTDAARADQHQEAVRVEYQTLTNTVTRYVQIHPALAACGLDADGLRIWNAANAGSGNGSPASDDRAAVAGVVSAAASSN